MFNLVPLVAGLAAATGVVVWVWYYSLTPEDQKQVDLLAARLAWESYSTALEDLTHHQKTVVYQDAKDRLGW